MRREKHNRQLSFSRSKIEGRKKEAKEGKKEGKKKETKEERKQTSKEIGRASCRERV